MADEERDATSFMDCLACGLGGAAMLCFILITLPHQGATIKSQAQVPGRPTPAKASPPGENSEPRPLLFRIGHSCPIAKLEKPEDADMSKRDRAAQVSLSTRRKAEARISILRAPGSSVKLAVRVVGCTAGTAIGIENLRRIGPEGESFGVEASGEGYLRLANGRWRWDSTP